MDYFMTMPVSELRNIVKEVAEIGKQRIQISDKNSW